MDQWRAKRGGGEEKTRWDQRPGGYARAPLPHGPHPIPFLGGDPTPGPNPHLLASQMPIVLGPASSWAGKAITFQSPCSAPGRRSILKMGPYRLARTIAAEAAVWWLPKTRA